MSKKNVLRLGILLSCFGILGFGYGVNSLIKDSNTEIHEYQLLTWEDTLTDVPTIYRQRGKNTKSEIILYVSRYSGKRFRIDYGVLDQHMKNQILQELKVGSKVKMSILKSDYQYINNRQPWSLSEGFDKFKHQFGVTLYSLEDEEIVYFDLEQMNSFNQGSSFLPLLGCSFFLLVSIAMFFNLRKELKAKTKE